MHAEIKHHTPLLACITLYIPLKSLGAPSCLSNCSAIDFKFSRSMSKSRFSPGLWTFRAEVSTKLSVVKSLHGMVWAVATREASKIKINALETSLQHWKLQILASGRRQLCLTQCLKQSILLLRQLVPHCVALPNGPAQGLLLQLVPMWNLHTIHLLELQAPAQWFAVLYNLQTLELDPAEHLS